MLEGLDHVVLLVLDLDAAVADHRGRGFTVTPGGVHAGGLTHNALVGFQDGTYLELVAFLGPAAARGTHAWAPVAERGGGWADFAVLSNDLRQDAAALGALVTKPPADDGRTRPDGLQITWRAARLAPPLPFLIEDLTARELRVPGGDAARHANGIKGVKRVIVGATDPAGAKARYARLAERGAPDVDIRRAARDGLMDVALA